MNLLALDLASSSGWASYQPEGAPILSSGTLVLPKTGKDVGHFLFIFHVAIKQMIEDPRPGVVVYETPWIGPKTSQAVARKLMGLAGVLEMVCYERSITCREVNNATVRKHFIGKGRGQRAELKALTIAACEKRGWAPNNDDEADALAILDYAAHTMALNVPWPAFEMFPA